MIELFAAAIILCVFCFAVGMVVFGILSFLHGWYKDKRAARKQPSHW